MTDTKRVVLRCKDGAEALVFNKYDYSTQEDLDIDFEINIEDSYCGGDFMGIKGRFKRAWRAFWAKPIYYTGIYTDDKEMVKKWLTDCLALVENK
jgi:hypothetical protein